MSKGAEWLGGLVVGVGVGVVVGLALSPRLATAVPGDWVVVAPTDSWVIYSVNGVVHQHEAGTTGQVRNHKDTKDKFGRPIIDAKGAGVIRIGG